MAEFTVIPELMYSISLGFHKFEKGFLAHLTSQSHRKFLKCPSCNVFDTATNAGRQGKAAQGGFAISSIQCSKNRKGCGFKSRPNNWLNHSGLQDLAMTWDESLKLAKTDALSNVSAPTDLSKKLTQQTSIANHFKRQRVEPSGATEDDTVMTSEQTRIEIPANPTALAQPEVIASPAQHPQTTEPAPSTPDLSSILLRLVTLEDENRKIQSTLSSILRLLENVLHPSVAASPTATAPQLIHPTPSFPPLPPAAPRFVNNTSAGSVNGHQQHRSVSFAAVAARPVVAHIPVVHPEPRDHQLPARQKRRFASSLFRERGPPAAFRKMYVKITDSRALKKMKNMGQTTALIREVMRSTGLKKHVIRFSLIGNSVLELYYFADHHDDVIDRLDEHGIFILHGFDPSLIPQHGVAINADEQAFKRLSHLYRTTTLVKLRETILEGHPAFLRARITESFERSAAPFGPLPLVAPPGHQIVYTHEPGSAGRDTPTPTIVPVREISDMFIDEETLQDPNQNSTQTQHQAAKDSQLQ
jgi:hypothetical protein